MIPVSPELRKETQTRIWVKIPEYIRDKKIHQIHIIPKYKGRFFEVAYIFEDDEVAKAQIDESKFMGIDVGVNNLATCATSDGESFIIDGKKLKSANQWYNKQLSRLSSVKDKQGYTKRHTKKQYLITKHRNNRVNNYIYCATKYIVNYCIEKHIGTVVVGYNNGFQENTKLGKVRNQNFVMIPFGRLSHRIEYLCNQHGIRYVEQEESYTSKANFFQSDKMPTWNAQNSKQGNFTGKRIKRGLYKDFVTGRLHNDDTMAALNIIRKSNLTALTSLQARGYVNEPARILISS